MNELIWNLFSQTGNVETYLLLKSIENEQHDSEDQQFTEQEIASSQTKL